MSISIYSLPACLTIEMSIRNSERVTFDSSHFLLKAKFFPCLILSGAFLKKKEENSKIFRRQMGSFYQVVCRFPLLFPQGYLKACSKLFRMRLAIFHECVAKIFLRKLFFLCKNGVDFKKNPSKSRSRKRLFHGYFQTIKLMSLANGGGQSLVIPILTSTFAPTLILRQSRK